MNSKVNDPPSQELIERLVGAVFPSMAMLAGMQLDVFTPLADNPSTPEELANSLSVSSVKLTPLLYALVMAELLTIEDGVFSNSPVADYYLVQGRPNYLGSRHEVLSGMWSATLNTAETIRTGIPQDKHDFATMSNEELSTAFRGLHPVALATGRELSEIFDFSRFRHMLDAGGGSGGLAIGACQSCPDLRATVADLPAVTPITESFVAEAGIGDRITVKDINICDRRMDETYDVAVLRAIIQVLSRDDARKALHNVSESLEPGGSLYVVGAILDDTRLSPPGTVAFNLVFINVYDEGQAYTVQEHREWLAEAGFVDVEAKGEVQGRKVITARKS